MNYVTDAVFKHCLISGGVFCFFPKRAGGREADPPAPSLLSLCIQPVSRGALAFTPSFIQRVLVEGQALCVCRGQRGRPSSPEATTPCVTSSAEALGSGERVFWCTLLTEQSVP